MDRPINDPARVRGHSIPLDPPANDRLAEVQLQVLWDEILTRDLTIEVMGPPVRAYSNFLRGIKSLPVRISN